MKLARKYRPRTTKSTANRVIIKDTKYFTPAHQRLLARTDSLSPSVITICVTHARQAKIDAKLKIMKHTTRHDVYEQQIINVDKDPIVRRLF